MLHHRAQPHRDAVTEPPGSDGGSCLPRDSKAALGAESYGTDDPVDQAFNRLLRNRQRSEMCALQNRCCGAVRDRDLVARVWGRCWRWRRRSEPRAW